MAKPRLLIIDDDENFVSDLKLLLDEDFLCSSACSAEKGLEILAQKDIDAILLDIDLGPGIDGLEVLERINKTEIPIPIIMITKDKSIDTVVKAMKRGAYDYIGKKPDLSELRLLVDKAIEDYSIRKDNIVFREELKGRNGELLGDSEAITEIRDKIAKLSRVDSTVLITGETGTGKELVARRIHYQSPRENRPFVTVNCAAIPEHLFESELFGHEKGAFTGALQKRIGKFERADRGTIFLDEIAELNSSLQAKLLRVIDHRQFERVGGTEMLTADVRIIAATNRDLKAGVKSGKFRDDLYFRLNVSSIHIPPLRERRQDIPVLAKCCIAEKSAKLGRKIKGLSDRAMDMLIAHNWPGNVRELENILENAIIYAEGDFLDEISFANLRDDFRSFQDYETAKQAVLEKFQKDYIVTILKTTDWNMTHAARRMGITRQGLQKMMKSLRIDPNKYSQPV